MKVITVRAVLACLIWSRLVLLGAGTLGIAAGAVLLMIGNPSVSTVRAMGAEFIISTAIFAAIGIVHFKIELSQQRTINSQERIIKAKEEMLNSSDQAMAALINRLRGKSPREE